MRNIIKGYLIALTIVFFYLLLRCNSLFLDFKYYRDPSFSMMNHEEMPCDKILVNHVSNEIDILLILSLFTLIGIIVNICLLFKVRKDKPTNL